jgi:[ribosomal protein S18]-alanine N-acetyltransferase
MDIQIYKLGTEHLDDVMEIERLSFPQPWTRGMFEREICLPISRFFVAMRGNKVVGYAGFWFVTDEAHIVNLAVHPGLRKQGIGRLLLDHIEKKMKLQNLKKALLEVRVGNTAARKLYELRGYKANGLRKDYYVDEDAVLMEKGLESH